MDISSINKKISNLFREIEFQFEKDLDVAAELIEEYGELLQDARYYSLKSMLFYYQGDIESGISFLKEGLIKHPFNFDIHYNLGFLLGEKKEYIDGINHYSFSIKYTKNGEDKKSAEDNIERLLNELYTTGNKDIKKDIDNLKKQFNIFDGKVFPLGLKGESLIRKVSRYEQGKSFLVNMYKAYNVVNLDDNSRFHFKTELIDGKQIESSYTYSSKSPFILPISLIDRATDFKINYNSQTFDFKQETLNFNKYNYLRFSEAGNLKIKTNKPIFIGNPIQLETDEQKPKLVMKIFIDGLAYKIIENEELQKLMPNTAAFFENGFISKNCFINSEWTLPSKASINTGKYATKHRLLHPTHSYKFEKYNKLMAEYFKEADFYTARIDTNWRTTPGFGYYKGFERLIYQNFSGGMDCRNVVSEAIEHISSFKETNNFLTLSMMDLHNVPDEIENHLFTEINTDITLKKNQQQKGSTSVLTKYDEVKIYKYKQEIKRVDIYLGVLFDFIGKTFNEDEYVILLHSDHGQTFLDKEGTLYSDSRIKVPFMMKGKNVPSIHSNEIIETVDILPAMLKYSDIDIPKDIDGELPKALGGNLSRNFAFTQIIHPNQPYRGIISENDFTFVLETKGNVGEDLTVSFVDYSTKYINKNTKEDVSNQYKDKVEIYESYIFSQIKEFVRW